MTNNSDLISNIDVIVLAAGKSKRFGYKNKLLIKINNKPLICHIVDNIFSAYPYEIKVVIGFEKDKVKEILKNKNVKFIENSNYNNGQSTSIIKAIGCLSSASNAVMICLADMPLITSNEYSKILLSHLKYGGPEKITLPYNEKRGNPVILGKRYYKLLKGLSGDLGAKNIINKYYYNIIKVKLKSKNCFIDLNTQNDVNHYFKV